MKTQRETRLGGEALGQLLLVLSFSMLVLTVYYRPPVLLTSLVMIFAASACAVVLVTPLVIRMARKAGAMDYPGIRKIHFEPTPRWGGIPVSMAVALALVLTSMRYMPNLKALLVGSLLVLLVGLIDDLKGVRAVIRLLVQLLACVILIADGIHVTFLPSSWGWLETAGEWLITSVWIIGIVNAVNFLDGMDGLVAGLVAGTSAIYFLLAMLLHANMLAYCSVALFGASLGFLSVNIKPAQIFLGDGGSTFLGFFLAALSIQGGWAKDEPLVSFCIPVLVLSVPIYDMVFTTVARIASGKVASFKSWLEFTGRDHLHHRLEALGLSRGRVVVTIWFLNIAIGLGAITLFEARTYGAVALIAQAVCVYSVLALFEVLGTRKMNLHAPRVGQRVDQGSQQPLLRSTGTAENGQDPAAKKQVKEIY